MRSAKVSTRYPYRYDGEGNRLCAVCRKPMPGLKKGCKPKYCSEVCREKAYVECLPGHARMRVGQRDKGVCFRCGWDAGFVERVLRWLPYATDWGYQEGRDAAWVVRCILGLDRRRTLWEAHHKVAVADGGGLCGLDGYETLCFRCHGKESGQQKRKRNSRKNEGA